MVDLRKNVATHGPPQGKDVQRLGNCPLLDGNGGDSLELNPSSYNDLVAIVTQMPPETRGWCSRLALVGLDGLEVGFDIVPLL